MQFVLELIILLVLILIISIAWIEMHYRKQPAFLAAKKLPGNAWFFPIIGNLHEVLTITEAGKLTRFILMQY